MKPDTEWRDYDVIVVGSGGAGSAAAHAASESGARVLVVAKDPVGCSDTKISEGVVAVRGSGEDGDTAEALAENLRMGGDDLPDPKITAAFAEDSETGYDWLRRHGLRPRIDEKRRGPQALPVALGGHTHRRSVAHPHGGVSVAHAGWNAVVQGTGIDYLEDAWFLDVITAETDGERHVVGGIVYDAIQGKMLAVRAPSVIIAAGGLGTLFFPNTDTMRGNTGDSYALALRAGATLIDMEQVQFLPFCLTSPPAYEGLLVGEPGTVGFLGVLRDGNGKLLLDGVILRTRAECSAAIMRAVFSGNGTEHGGCYLDLTANVRAPRSGPYFDRFLRTALPAVMATVRQALGKESAKFQEPWEVRPSAHYCMGGVRVDADSATVADDPARAVHGLYAAGQAMGGVFGSNRLGSTGLAETTIFGGRAGRAAAQRATQKRGEPDSSLFDSALEPYKRLFGHEGTEVPASLIRKLQADSWSGIGPARTQEGLDTTLDTIDDLRRAAEHIAIPDGAIWNQSFIDTVELINMLDTAEAVTRAALDRPDSLGAHMRLDGRKSPSLFATASSTAVRRDAARAWSVSRVARVPTPWPRRLTHLFGNGKRKLAIKLLRLLPLHTQDRILEKRYRSLMGPIEDTPESATA